MLLNYVLAILALALSLYINAFFRAGFIRKSGLIPRGLPRGGSLSLFYGG
jgi:hypothetical protein